MSMVGFPLLLIPLAIYNIIVLLMPGVSLAETLVTLPLMTSGAEWKVTLSDVLVTLGILTLLLEVIKGARPGAKYLTDHLLSLIIFGGAVTEFLLWPRFANSTYFLLLLLALTDFLTGVALRVRRTPAIAGASGSARHAPADVSDERDHAGASVSAGEPAWPAHPEPVIEHPEAKAEPKPAASPEPEATPAESQSGRNATPQPPETPH